MKNRVDLKIGAYFDMFERVGCSYLQRKQSLTIVFVSLEVVYFPKRLKHLK